MAFLLSERSSRLCAASGVDLDPLRVNFQPWTRCSIARSASLRLLNSPVIIHVIVFFPAFWSLTRFRGHPKLCQELFYRGRPQHLPLHHAPTGYTLVLDHAEVAVLLTVLVPNLLAQEHHQPGIAVPPPRRE